MSHSPAPAPVSLLIDGKEVTVPAGQTILQAGQKLGVYVPHFCYHPGLSIVGQCRMCFVEIEGQPKLATACSTAVAPNMKVSTTSQKVKQGQNGTLEFILLNHPLDCPICDRGGECRLQDYTYEYGPPRSRMEDEKEFRDKHKPISKEVVLDQERCILCTRCERFSSEVDGRAELVVNNRAVHSVIDVFDGRPMQSKFTGNVVDLCPVGALTAQDFRFVARPWELKQHEGLCTGCGVGCNVTIDTKNRHPGIPRPEAPAPEIVRLTPRENLEVNTWWMCDKGRWGYHFNNDSEKRLQRPLLRRSKGDALTEVSLREVQALLETPKGSWEFWADDALPHEGIAWAKELMGSWNTRGRKVSQLNASDFAGEFLKFWGTRMTSPWTAGRADWSTIKTVVSTMDYRAMEDVAPVLSLKLGQRLRKGLLKWEVLSTKDWSAKDFDTATTAWLAPPPRDGAELKPLAKLPGEARLLLLWAQANARGLLNEGIVPVEALAASLKGKSPSGPVFVFAQKTQNALPAEALAYFRKAPFLVVADSFRTDLVDAADAVLPLNPLYESEATLTSIENHRQFSPGVRVHHPSIPVLERGGPAISAALRTL